MWGERRALALVLALVGVILASLPLVAEVVGAAFYVWGLGVAACLLVALWSGAVGMAARGSLREPARTTRAWLKGALAVTILALLLTRLA